MEKVLLILMTVFPTLVFASSGNDILSLGAAIGLELFVSIHMSAFVLYPLANMFNKDGNTKKLFLKLFIIRAAILLFFDIFVTTSIAFFDFILVFIGAFLIVPICSSITKKSPYKKTVVNYTNKIANSNNGILIKCTKCGGTLAITDTACKNCGTPFDGNNVKIEINTDPNTQGVQNIGVLPPLNYDKMFDLTEEQMLEEFINRQLVKAGIDKNTKLIPKEVLKRKKILSIIFSILLFIYISLIFFHFPILTYIIGIIILIIFFAKTRKYDLIQYLKKEIKSRPGEKISNIVMNAKTTFVKDNRKKVSIPAVCLAIILPLIIFINPVILYEKVDNGYAVRFYAFGLTNFETATIPEKYKGEKVVSLRGNTFSNMPFLKEVTWPDTIIEIRGQAFKNDKRLTKVNIPKNLEYLGGGAFYNCKSITEIELPDTLVELGGEAFYNAISLESIKLSSNLTEIRGNTFENCYSLKEITIPDKVTRIGGHAFYGCSSLSKVTLTENSKLREIGSSAFRLCRSLKEIKIPKTTIIDSRSFKESPTKVKRFGDLDYGNIINSNNYEYNTFLHLSIKDNEKTKINEYRTNAQLQDAYLTLEKVKIHQTSNEFTLKYTDPSTEKTFTLTKTNPYVIINDNLAIEISDEYIFDYDASISLNVYYN